MTVPLFEPLSLTLSEDRPSVRPYAETGVGNPHIPVTRIRGDMSLSDLTSLTSKERILLYLSEFIHMEERYELPSDLVQETISYCTGIQRKHLSKYLDDLMGEGTVVERKAHIQGLKQRMNGYYLTASGYSKAQELRQRIGSVEVEFNNGGRAMRMRVSKIIDATPARVTYCDVVREAVRNGRLTMQDLLDIDAKKRKALETRESSTDIYKRALDTAWRDGQVTATERFLIEELRKHLNVTDAQHKALEAEILKTVAQDHMEFVRIYRGVLEIAMADGDISGAEADIIEILRRNFMISSDEHSELLSEVEIVVHGPSGSLT